MTPKQFVSALADVRLPSVFNPYAQRCPLHDCADAPLKRRRNLQRFIEAALGASVDTIWIARDLGYRGGRRTGVPLTDEIHLGHAGRLLGGIGLERATEGPLVAERTAAVVWRAIVRIGQPVVLWNVFPLHPHEPEDPFSNRCHTQFERDATWPLLQALVGMCQPKQIIAIGRDAQIALGVLHIPVATVRHPSYGGQGAFIAGLYKLYGIEDDAAIDDGAVLPFGEDYSATSKLALA